MEAEQIEKKEKNIHDFFKPLSLEDIDEKININIDRYGYSLLELKGLFELELSMIERDILQNRYAQLNLNPHDFYRTYQVLLRRCFNSEMQAQNLKEQIRHLENRIIGELKNGSIS